MNKDTKKRVRQLAVLHHETRWNLVGVETDIIGDRSALNVVAEAHERLCQLYLLIVGEAVAQQRADASDEDMAKLDAAEPERCLSLAKTNIQQGFMWLKRAIQQPATLTPTLTDRE